MRYPDPQDFDSPDDYYDALDMYEQNGIEDEDRAEAEYEKMMESRDYPDISDDEFYRRY